MTQARGDRPRVVYIDHVARWSGGEIALARLLKALSGQVDAHVILGEDGDLVPALRAIDGVTVEVLPMDPRLRDTRRHEVTSRRLPLSNLVTLGRYVWRLRRRLAPDLEREFGWMLNYGDGGGGLLVRPAGDQADAMPGAVAKG